MRLLKIATILLLLSSVQGCVDSNSTNSQPITTPTPFPTPSVITPAPTNPGCPKGKVWVYEGRSVRSPWRCMSPKDYHNQ